MPSSLATEKTLYVTDPDLVPLKPEDAALTPKELTWLANQERKILGQRSKYIPHQGTREKARRLRQLGVK